MIDFLTQHSLLTNLAFVGVVVATVLSALLLLSTSSRFTKSRVYLLPLACATLMLVWTVWSFLYFGQDETSNLHRHNWASSFVAALFYGAIPFIIGYLIGLALHHGSLLWARRSLFFSSMLFLLGLVFSTTLILAIFYGLGLLATG